MLDFREVSALPILGNPMREHNECAMSSFYIRETIPFIVVSLVGPCTLLRTYMKGHVTNIEKDSLENTNFRKVLFTDERLQLVVMSLLPNEDIGEEVHDLDQFIRVESGSGKTILDGVETSVGDGFSIIIPAGTRHNIINTSFDMPMKLYTLYAPPNHKDGTIHKTKAEAQAAEEHSAT